MRLSSEAVFNLTFPENSAVLCAPLDAKAGGRAGKGGHPTIFKSRADPRYQTVLKAVQKAKILSTPKIRATIPPTTSRAGRT